MRPCPPALRAWSLRIAVAGAAVATPGIAFAQRGLPPVPLQLPKCDLQVTGINSGSNDVEVTSVRYSEGSTAPATLSATGGTLDIPATNTRVQRQYGRLAACDAGEVQVTLVLKATPQRTQTLRLTVTPQRRTVELGDVKRLF